MLTTRYLLSRDKVSAATAYGCNRKVTTHVAYQKETSPCPSSGGTLPCRSVSPLNSHHKTLHAPGQNEEKYALEEPQRDYNIRRLEWRLR
jgi:hypothetical protein